MADAAEKLPVKAEEEKEEKAEGAPAAEGAEAIAEGQEAPTPKKKSKLKLILLITIPLLVLAGGGAAAYFFFFAKKEAPVAAGPDGAPLAEGEAGKSPEEGAASTEEATKDVKPENTFFHALPEMMVNLNTENNKISFLKFQATLEIDDQKSVEKLTKVMPRILDTIQVYVRELTVNDLKSSLGIEKLRQELLKRIVLIAKDVKIYDILFPEMLTQ